MNDNKIRVCLVDDDETDRMAVQRMLQQASGDYKVTEAVDVAGATELLNTDSFDVALVDYRLPDGTAEDILRNGLLTAQTPVVVLTGLDDRSVAKRMLRRGAQDYLVKGAFDGDLLARAIRYSLERKRGEDLRRQLMRADRLAAIGRLAAAVAHEVNNPATFIISNLEITQKRLARLRHLIMPRLDEDTAEEAQQLLDRIQELTNDNVGGLRRITDVVRDLGTFSRMDTDEVELVNINDVLVNVEKLAHNELRHRAEVEFELDQTIPPILGARGRLSQVFTNILMNAAQALGDGAASENRIQIATERRDDEISIRIADSGSGIPAEHLESIFDPYFTTKSPGEGTGLGLAVCLELIQAHRGEIDIESIVGQGTLVTISLPFDTGLIATSPVDASMDDMKPPRLRPRVLLIDDERQLLHSMAEALEDSIDVVGAATGEAALQIAQLDDDFDAVICDVQIPDIDGITVWEQVKEFNPSLAARFVFLTGGAITQRAKKFLDGTHLPVLEKPITPGQLEDFVEFTMSAPMVEG